MGEFSGGQLRCIDVFPWLGGSGGAPKGDALNWARHDLGQRGTLGRVRLLSWVSEQIVERFDHWTVRELMPGLPESVSLLRMGMSTRTRNALVRAGLHSVGDLMELPVNDLIALPRVGRVVAIELLATLCDLATDGDFSAGYGPTAAGDAPGFIGDCSAADAVADLTQVAQWLVAIGNPDHPVLEASSLGPPVEIRLMVERLSRLTARDLVPITLHAEGTPAEFLGAVLGHLPTRDWEVLRDARFVEPPVSRQQIAERLGISTSRVAQIEARAELVMQSAIETSESIQAVSRRIQDLGSDVIPLDLLLRQIPSLSELVTRVEQPVWQVLASIDRGYHIEPPWYYKPDARQTAFARFGAVRNDYGVATLADLGDLSPMLVTPEGDESLRAWLSHCGLVVHGDFVLAQTRSVWEASVAALWVAGEPLSAEQIRQGLVQECSVESIRRNLSGDSRVARTDKDRWALCEWGLPRYPGLRALVREHLSANGGAISLVELERLVTSKFSVSASSVTTVANQAPFCTRRGTVFLSLDVPPPAHTGPDVTARPAARVGMTRSDDRELPSPRRRDAPYPQASVTLETLMCAGLISAGDSLTCRLANRYASAVLLGDTSIRLADGRSFTAPTTALAAAGIPHHSGWMMWIHGPSNCSLDALRTRFVVENANRSPSIG